MNPFITIIIPIYNVGVYLPNCIESVLNQSYGNFELLLVNDGSTDDSGAICDKYAESDKRIQVRHILNAGVSNARNTGIKMARGIWLLFLDGDDTLESHALEIINQSLMDYKDLDMVLGSFKYLINGEVVMADNGDCIKTGIDLVYDYGSWNVKTCMGSFAVRKEILDHHMILFNTSTKYGEDVEFLNYCLLHSCKVKVTHEYLMNYLVHPTSAIAKVSLDRFDCYEARWRTLCYIEHHYPEYKHIESLYQDHLLPEAIIDTTYLLCRNGFNPFELMRYLKQKNYDQVLLSVRDNENTPKEIRQRILKFQESPFLTWAGCYLSAHYFNMRQNLGLWKRRVLSA